MDTKPQTRQPGQPGQPSSPADAQQGQMETPGGQPSQDSRFGQDKSPGQQGTARQGQEKSQPAREVSPVGQQGGQGSPNPSVSTLLPPVDIFEDESGFTLMADMPGVAKEQLLVRVTGDNLLIEGAATVPVSGTMELVYGEVQTPQYRRSFTLSRELDPGKIEAKLANGVLTLRIPKAEQARPRRIEISAG